MHAEEDVVGYVCKLVDASRSAFSLLTSLYFCQEEFIM